jgi:hypothetical protein
LLPAPAIAGARQHDERYVVSLVERAEKTRNVTADASGFRRDG